MTDIADIFSSKAKFQLLKLLVKFEQEIPLRSIASLTDLPIRSAVLGLESLLQQKIICDTKPGYHRLFKLNRAHPFYAELKNIFSQIERSELKIRSRSYQREVTRAFEFAQSAQHFFEKG